ncbi:DHH family phosphoesterase, partial [Bacillus anthracis]|uniref:DHH family phosphoesterase n=1 Tax=Bacillus anthracis TaxID=1392 RepID=UPI0037BFA7D5
MRELPPDISLVTTVDNGCSALDAMKVAKERGVTVIFTDHHEVSGGRPDCPAFITPKRSD